MRRDVWSFGRRTLTQLAAERVVEVLDRGWCRRDLAQVVDARFGRRGVAPSDPRARWFCILGACRRVEIEADAVASAYGDPHYGWLGDLYERMYRVAYITDAGGIAEYNDGMCRDAEDAMEFVRRSMGAEGVGKHPYGDTIGVATTEEA